MKEYITYPDGKKYNAITVMINKRFHFKNEGYEWMNKPTKEKNDSRHYHIHTRTCGFWGFVEDSGLIISEERGKTIFINAENGKKIGWIV